ncbi:MAG: tyrosine-type recombinase/integrase [Cyanobium sp.]
MRQFHEPNVVVGSDHLDQGGVQNAVKRVFTEAGVTKAASCHTFSYSFATHLLERGQDIRTIQEMLWHQGVSTTMIYAHMLNLGSLGVRSTVDISYRFEQLALWPVNHGYTGLCVAENEQHGTIFEMLPPMANHGLRKDVTLDP